MGGILELQADMRGNPCCRLHTPQGMGSHGQQSGQHAELTWLQPPFSMCRAEDLGPGTWRFQSNFALFSSQTWPRTVRLSES